MGKINLSKFNWNLLRRLPSEDKILKDAIKTLKLQIVKAQLQRDLKEINQGCDQ